MSQSRMSLTPTKSRTPNEQEGRVNRSSSLPDGLQSAANTSGQNSVMGSRNKTDPLQDGKLLVLKVIGKVNLRIERKEYADLIKIVNQIPGDVLVLILDDLSMEELYKDIPNSLASLAAFFSKIYQDRGDRFPAKILRSEDFIHNLVRYFSDLLKYNNETFASPQSRDYIKNVFTICAQVDPGFRERLAERVNSFSEALQGFSKHDLVEMVSRSSSKYYMRIHEALKYEMERSVSQHKSALQRLAEVFYKIPHQDFDVSIPLSSQEKMKDRTLQHMQNMPTQVIENRLFFNQAVLTAVEVPAKHQTAVLDLAAKLESRVQHDKKVLQLLKQINEEFDASLEKEKAMELLERFHHAYRLVQELAEEAVKGSHGSPGSPLKGTGAHSGVASKRSRGSSYGSDTDVFESVTPFEETELSSSAESDKNEEDTSKVPKNHRDHKGDEEVMKIKKQLQQKDKELEAAKGQINRLTDREKDLLERLADQAQRQLKKGGKFEDLSAGACRPTALVEQYDELCTQVRIDALDDLDQLDSLENLQDSGDLKNKILFSVVVVSFRTVQHYLAEKHHKLQKLLGIPEGENKTDNARELEEQVTVYLRETAGRFKVDHVTKDVCKQLWSTLYDFPELKSCTNLKLYIDKCVRLAWMLSVQIPPMIIEHEAAQFTTTMHTRFFSSDMEAAAIKYHVWPALIDEGDGHVYYKGIVVT